MSYSEGEELRVLLHGETERTVTFERETADGMFLVREDDTRYTVGPGEVEGRVSELTG